MKMVTAIIQPFRLHSVREALQDAKIKGMTVTECTGHGQNSDMKQVPRASWDATDLQPKLMVEVAVDDCDVAPIVEAIRSSSASGRVDDGKIFVTTLEYVIRVRTGEMSDKQP